MRSGIPALGGVVPLHCFIYGPLYKAVDALPTLRSVGLDSFLVSLWQGKRKPVQVGGVPSAVSFLPGFGSFDCS